VRGLLEFKNLIKIFICFDLLSKSQGTGLWNGALLGLMRTITVVTANLRAGYSSVTRLLAISAYDSQAQNGSVVGDTASAVPWQGADRMVVCALAVSAQAASARRWGIADSRVSTCCGKVTEETTVMTGSSFVVSRTDLLIWHMSDFSTAVTGRSHSVIKSYLDVGLYYNSKKVLGVDVLGDRTRSHIANVGLVVCFMIESGICHEHYVAIVPSCIPNQVVSAISWE
jgi:hypothetical protein